MQEKHARAQLRDVQLIASLSHLEKSDPASRPGSKNLADLVDLEWSATGTRTPTGDEPGISSAGSGWVYFAGVCAAGCSDLESDAIMMSQMPSLVSTSGTRAGAGSALSKAS